MAPLRRLVDALPEPQGPHWEVAFAVMAVRGAQARSRGGFAAAYGLSADEVGRLESGAVPLSEVPGAAAVAHPGRGAGGHQLGRQPHLA